MHFYSCGILKQYTIQYNTEGGGGGGGGGTPGADVGGGGGGGGGRCKMPFLSVGDDSVKTIIFVIYTHLDSAHTDN
jgi:hypothetical protein